MEQWKWDSDLAASVSWVWLTENQPKLHPRHQFMSKQGEAVGWWLLLIWADCSESKFRVGFVNKNAELPLSHWAQREQRLSRTIPRNSPQIGSSVQSSLPSTKVKTSQTNPLTPFLSLGQAGALQDPENRVGNKRGRMGQLLLAGMAGSRQIWPLALWEQQEFTIHSGDWKECPRAHPHATHISPAVGFHSFQTHFYISLGPSSRRVWISESADQ